MMKKFIAILAAGWLLGLISLTLVYLLPTERMEQNVRSSMEVFYTESVYPQQVPGYKATQLDNETDAIMLLGAIYDGGGLFCHKAGNARCKSGYIGYSFQV